MTRGALMAFERDQGLTTDGLAGPAAWPALLHAAIAQPPPDALATRTPWCNGHRAAVADASGTTDKIVVRTPANTGVPAAPDRPGHLPGVRAHRVGHDERHQPGRQSHYSDPGVPWISYFNGGDALHGFPRGSYGVPQSVGCVELPIGAAAKVWPYTPVGTLVNVAI